MSRGRSWYGLSHWVTTLQCNVVTHWLSPYPEGFQHELWESMGHSHNNNNNNNNNNDNNNTEQKPRAYSVGYTTYIRSIVTQLFFTILATLHVPNNSYMRAKCLASYKIRDLYIYICIYTHIPDNTLIACQRLAYVWLLSLRCFAISYYNEYRP